MNKEDFFIKWRHPQYADLELMRSDIDLLCESYAAAVEAEKWKKYPGNKPEKAPELYNVTLNNGLVVEAAYTTHDVWYRGMEVYSNVIAFRELPKPYQQEGGVINEKC